MLTMLSLLCSMKQDFFFWQILLVVIHQPVFIMKTYSIISGEQQVSGPQHKSVDTSPKAAVVCWCVQKRESAEQPVPLDA